MNEVGLFYRAQNQPAGTHLALRWNGRVRYTVPREAAAQTICWSTFRPGRLELPMRAIARLPQIFGAVSCVEDEKLAMIREAIGNEAGLSCRRTGATGPWSKDTILLLDRNTVKPLYVVKAGVGVAVNLLFQNEANWLQNLHEQAPLAGHIPELVAHRSGADLSFIAESPLPGKLDYDFGELHVTFLRKFQDYSRKIIRYEESRLCRNLRSRLSSLSGLLTDTWSLRLQKSIQRIEISLSGAPMLFVAAHNDFTPWNIRVEHGTARIFDWEYAEDEQLPLFDPLHFILMPMALSRRPADKILQSMNKTLLLCPQWLGKDSCYQAQTQALAYMMNLCTLYLTAERGKSEPNPVLESYAQTIDSMVNH